MDFITWWFNDHYIWSTLMMPVFSFAYAIYEESFGHLIGSMLVMLLWTLVGVASRD